MCGIHDLPAMTATVVVVVVVPAWEGDMHDSSRRDVREGEKDAYGIQFFTPFLHKFKDRVG